MQQEPEWRWGEAGGNLTLFAPISSSTYLAEGGCQLSRFDTNGAVAGMVTVYAIWLFHTIQTWF